MEKLVYVLWRADGDEPATFRRRRVDQVAPRLREAGAHRIAVNAVDDAVQDKLGARVGSFEPPVDGMLSFWLDNGDDRGPCEAALAAACSRIAGYLVVESVPLVNTTHCAAPGERTPGINVVTCIERPERLSVEAWIAHWHGHHTPMANEVQCTYLYVRNVVARALTADAPPWRGIVEEGFPVEAVTDPMLWYKADGDPAVFKRNLDRMLESVRAFLDIDRVEHHPMSEYRLDAG